MLISSSAYNLHYVSLSCINTIINNMYTVYRFHINQATDVCRGSFWTTNERQRLLRCSCSWRPTLEAPRFAHSTTLCWACFSPFKTGLKRCGLNCNTCQYSRICPKNLNSIIIFWSLQSNYRYRKQVVLLDFFRFYKGALINIATSPLSPQWAACWNSQLVKWRLQWWVPWWSGVPLTTWMYKGTFQMITFLLICDIW